MSLPHLILVGTAQTVPIQYEEVPKDALPELYGEVGDYPETSEELQKLVRQSHAAEQLIHKTLDDLQRLGKIWTQRLSVGCFYFQVPRIESYAGIHIESVGSVPSLLSAILHRRRRRDKRKDTLTTAQENRFLTVLKLWKFKHKQGEWFLSPPTGLPIPNGRVTFESDHVRFHGARVRSAMGLDRQIRSISYNDKKRWRVSDEGVLESSPDSNRNPTAWSTASKLSFPKLLEVRAAVSALREAPKKSLRVTTKEREEIQKSIHACPEVVRAGLTTVDLEVCVVCGLTGRGHPHRSVDVLKASARELKQLVFLKEGGAIHTHEEVSDGDV